MIDKEDFYQAYIDALNLQMRLGSKSPPFIDLFFSIIDARDRNERGDLKPNRTKARKFGAPEVPVL